MDDDWIRTFSKHALIDLLRLVVWNQHFCCVPLHTLASFDEFVNVFSISFLARVLSMLQVLIQYPSEYHSFMKDIKPISGNACLHTIFSPVFIQSDIVVANVALLNSDLHFLRNFVPLKQQKFMLCLLSVLAPNQESRLPNFGRSMEREEILMKKIGNRYDHATGYGTDDDDIPATKKTGASSRPNLFI